MYFFTGGQIEAGGGSIEADNFIANSIEIHPLIMIPRVRLNIRRAHLPAKHVHQGRA
jgi:hypothetical protein